MKKPIISICLGLFFGLAQAQNMAIDTWQTHFSYSDIQIICPAGDRLFAASEFGLFSVNTSDQSVNKLSELDGLSSNTVTSLNYNTAQKALVIGYASGQIDIIDENEITPVAGFYENATISNKKIFDLASDDQHIYAATNIGILVIRYSDKIISDHLHNIGSNAAEVEVSQLEIKNDTLFALTNEGIIYGDVNNNLLDFHNWTLIENSGNVSKIKSTSESLWAIVNETELFKIGAQKELEAIQSFDASIQDISNYKNGTGILFQDHLRSSADNFTSDIPLNSTTKAQALTELNDDFWIGDANKGLIRNDSEAILPDGPITQHIGSIKVINNELHVFYDSSYYRDGFSILENGSWNHISIEDAGIKDGAYYRSNYYYISPENGVYTNTSGATPEIIDQTVNFVPTAITANTNLWISAKGSTSLIKYDRDGNWTTSSSLNVGSSQIKKLDVSYGETLWALTNSNQLLAYNPEDDETRVFGTSSGLSSNAVTKIAIDNNDEIWIGTSSGLYNFYSATSAFDNDDTATPFTYDGTISYLGLNIDAITTDGGARIWVGSEDGLKVYNNALTELQFSFDRDNSPLSSNTIQQMAYQENLGIMHLLTDQGLLSYRSNSSSYQANHRNVKTFPNPVLPNYSGQVGISGVVGDATIKITNLNGKIVKEIQAYGSTASWDLTDFTGAEVNAGVYIILSADAEGNETFAGKIAVMRP